MHAVTHDGVFHADDVFGAALIRLTHPSWVIERSRDPKVLAGSQLRFDVGGRAGHQTGDYDHHQKEGAGKRENGIPYAAFGLLWSAFGLHLCGDLAVHAEVDRAFVQAIDAHDNGMALVGEPPIPGAFPVTISHVISNFNPSWDEEQDYDERFHEAVALAETILLRVIVRARGVVSARQIVREAVERADDPRIVVLDRFVPWQEALVEASKDALVIVYPSAGTWRVQVVPIQPGQPGTRHSLPESWAGLDSDGLIAVSAVPDATFCHRARFIAGAVSRDGALALAYASFLTPATSEGYPNVKQRGDTMTTETYPVQREIDLLVTSGFAEIDQAQTDRNHATWTQRGSRGDEIYLTRPIYRWTEAGREACRAYRYTTPMAYATDMRLETVRHCVYCGRITTGKKVGQRFERGRYKNRTVCLTCHAAGKELT